MTGDIVRVGILADTHIPHQVKRIPANVLGVFSNVDLILHAGDLDQVSALDDLKSLAPVIAVRGNLHLRFAARYLKNVRRVWQNGSSQLPKSVHLWI